MQPEALLCFWFRTRLVCRHTFRCFDFKRSYVELPETESVDRNCCIVPRCRAILVPSQAPLPCCAGEARLHSSSVFPDMGHCGSGSSWRTPQLTHQSPKTEDHKAVFGREGV